MDAFVPHGSKLGTGFSKAEKLAGQAIHPQHNASKGQSRANWISDLVALRKVVILCSYCRAKFNPRQAGYRRVYIPDYTGKTDGYTVNGDCDSCRVFTPNAGGGCAFQPEELYRLTSIDPQEQRRKARLKAKELSTWQFLQKRK